MQGGYGNLKLKSRLNSTPLHDDFQPRSARDINPNLLHTPRASMPDIKQGAIQPSKSFDHLAPKPPLFRSAQKSPNEELKRVLSEEDVSRIEYFRNRIAKCSENTGDQHSGIKARSQMQLNLQEISEEEKETEVLMSKRKFGEKCAYNNVQDFREKLERRCTKPFPVLLQKKRSMSSNEVPSFVVEKVGSVNLVYKDPLKR